MPRRARSSKSKYRLDVMSIIILLVMTIFGGLIGYSIGVSSGSNQILESLQTTQMMQGR